MGYQSGNKQILVLTTLVVIALALGAATFYYILPRNMSHVQAINVGVYWDSRCTNQVSQIDWGVIEPGTIKNVTVYIRNTGNSNMALSMNSANWSPTAGSNYMALGWNYGGQSIVPNQVLQTTLILSTSPSIQGITSFSFDIIVVGSG